MEKGEIDMFGSMFIISQIIFVIIFAIAIFNIIGIFTGKTQKRMMQRNMKTLKAMTEVMGEDMKDIVGNVAEMKKDVYQEHGDTFREVAQMEAEIETEKVRAKAQAIKDVFADENVSKASFSNETKTNRIVCQNCGSLIDSDSMYCKICGKRPF